MWQLCLKNVQDIIANDRKLRHAKDRTVTLEQEEQVLSQKVEQEKKQIQVLETVSTIVDQLENKALGLDECAKAFNELQVYCQANFFKIHPFFDFLKWLSNGFFQFFCIGKPL